MPFSHLPAVLATFALALSGWVDARHGGLLAPLLAGLLFGRGRRTVTSWLRAAGIGEGFRRAYSAVAAVGREAPWAAPSAFDAVRPLLGAGRLLVAIDDTPTRRYGPEVEGAGRHRHPSPGPADGPFLYGHVFVTLAALASHPRHGTRALPLRADLYARNRDLPDIPARRRPAFRTKIDMAAAQLRWAAEQAHGFRERWVVVDGGYACRDFLDAARDAAFTVVGRLRKDAALFTVPPPRKAGQRGRPRMYGASRVSLASRAAHPQGWQEVECEQYGKKVTKTVKTFLATWRPARGVVRVVLVKEEDRWLALFGTKPAATAAEVLEAAADRNALEQAFRDVKEVWGAGEQQVRNLHASAGCFNLCLWLVALVEAWAWDRPEEELVDRSASPWDDPARRASHADKRKAMQREALRAEISATLAGSPTEPEIRDMAERLLAMAV